MLDTIIPQPSDMGERPRLLRTDPTKVTTRELLAEQLRYECGGNGWNGIVLAEILQIPVSRARDLMEGRKPMLLEEVYTVCKAANVDIICFIESAHARGQRSPRIFADTTMAELVQIAADRGTTPERLIKEQGWVKLESSEVPVRMGGSAR